MLNKPAAESGLLNKSSNLAAALGVIKFIAVIATNLVTRCCNLNVQQPALKLICSTVKLDLSRTTKYAQINEGC
jgi:hypothetical protein